MSEKKYWKGLEELYNTPSYQKTVRNEFREELPFGEEIEGLMNAKTPRRDFLKYLGFSITAATIAASCEIQVRKAITYINKPVDITPGVPNYYASTYAQDGDYCPIVVKTLDGRPIKIEGNTSSSITRGGTSAMVQASVLSLYDTARLRYPMIQGKEATWEELDKAVMQGLASLGGSPVVLLTTTLMSPATEQLIQEFTQKYPGTRHVTYDAVSYAGMLLANEASYGKRAIPSYHFENAKAIVSLGADFLGTWLSPVEFASQYAQTRKIKGKKADLSQHIQFESYMSLTGANADYRYTHRPSQQPAVVLNLYNAVAQALGKPQLSNVPALQDESLQKGIQRAARLLASHPGEALVVCGSNNPQVQIVVNGLNEMLGAGGKTIDWNAPVNYRKGIDADMQQLVADMEAGKIGAVLIYGANPVYDYYDGQRFAEALKKVKLTVSFNERKDETTVLCQYVAPDHHYLENWGDAEPKAGYYSFMQPTIFPLFKTRAFQESLLAWMGQTPDWHGYLMKFWEPKLGGLEAWEEALQNGVIEPKQVSLAGAPFKGDVQAAAAQLAAQQPKTGELELVLYEKVGIRGGRWANNPWLQEMPDPISKCTWDNYVCISPALAWKLGVSINRFNENDLNRPVARISAAGKEITLPVLVLPGMPKDVIAVAVGYGRSPEVGKAAGGVGKNAYPWAGYNSQTGTYEYYQPAVSLAITGETYPLAITQTHNSFEGRPIILETTQKQYNEDPGEATREQREERERYGGENYATQGTLYPNLYDFPGLKWGMSIDLNSCIGCGACTIACQAENNVAVVGKDQVLAHHEMHWIRIDRYFSGDPENPQVVFQPMLCQQCDNAPCENVCPVAATNHSDEGLNQMIYNRCIGTRYCMNNCPYKVRRFNWRDWWGSTSFGGTKDTADMESELTRMVLNPDVTVRGRGVMEKCTFCVQRLQDAKLAAKKAGRPLMDGEAMTACQQACPTQAIVFGNVHDPGAAISQLREENKETRLYYVLDDLHTLPNVNYLVKVVNKDPGDFYVEPVQHVL